VKPKNPLILTFDCGTQSTRALLFDKQGTLIGKSQVRFEKPYLSPKPGWAEQDPDFYYHKICEASKLLWSTHSDYWSQIIGVTITVMRDTYVCLDAQKNPLRPVILWVDQRLASLKNLPLKPSSAALFHLTGMSDCIETLRRQGKSNWLIEHEPETWAKTDKYVLLSAYLTYRLTGELVDSVAAQIGHIPFDYKRKKWYSVQHYKFGIFNIDPHKLPELKEPGEVLGFITNQTAQDSIIPTGLPLIATGSDKGCETVGCGCIHEDEANLSFGTTSTIQWMLNKYIEPQTFLPSYPAPVAGYYNPEIQLFRGYWMLSWFKKEFAEKEEKEAIILGVSAEELLNKRLQEIPPGSDGLMLQPYWAPGIKSPEAKGMVLGFNDVHTRIHIYRAIIEGINYGLRDGLTSVEKRIGTKVKRLTVSGGGAISDIICQITANMFGLPIRRVQTYETSGLGSSLVGFLGLKEFASYEEAIQSMIHHDAEFIPDADTFKIYDDLFRKVYQKIYHRLKPLYREIRNINDYYFEKEDNE